MGRLGCRPTHPPGHRHIQYTELGDRVTGRREITVRSTYATRRVPSLRRYVAASIHQLPTLPRCEETGWSSYVTDGGLTGAPSWPFWLYVASSPGLVGRWLAGPTCMLHDA